MAELLDSVNKQLSTSIDFKRGMAAFFASSADNEQRALDAFETMKAERDVYKNKYEDKCDECDDLKSQLAEAKALIEQLTKKPVVNLTLKGKAKVNKLVTGDLHKIYAENDSDKGQQHKRISAGGQTYPHL